MPIEGLDHYNVRTRDLARARRFYTEALGLAEGPRPPFSVPGAWLYAGAAPLVHLVEDAEAPQGAVAALDHVAFRGRDLPGTLARLEAAGVAYELFDVPGRPLRQVFLRDPDGVRIEINFVLDASS